MKIYPVPGREGLRDPITRIKIPAQGREVPENPFWHRRLVHGDVSLTPPEAETVATTDDAPAT